MSNVSRVMNLVIVRENEEDCYAGMGYQLRDTVMERLKIITRPGSERICRYASEYALRHNRKKNIMNMTGRLFHKSFDEIGADYPNIEKGHWIVGIGAAKIAGTPEAFDGIVRPQGQ